MLFYLVKNGKMLNIKNICEWKCVWKNKIAVINALALTVSSLFFKSA
jgi:hypothetical protein